MSADLTLHRILKAPRRKVWACLTRADLLPHWFIPRPHSIEDCILELRPGGRFFTLMKVDGNLHPNDGSVLDVQPMSRLVFTDLMLADWQPVAEPDLGFTAVITLADHPEGTEYHVVARHRTPADAEKHEAMGFTQGWGTVADQLSEFAAQLED
jgi:uncharacterized protein YndB with AHSA1/START domain